MPARSRRFARSRRRFSIALAMCVLVATLLGPSSAFGLAAPSSASSFDAGFVAARSSMQVWRLTGEMSRQLSWQPDSSHAGEPAWGPTPYDSPTYALERISESTSLRSWRVRARYGFATDDPFPVGALPSRYAPYLAAEVDIQSSDARVRSLASDLVAGCVWQSDAVERIQRWVAANIRYDYTFSSRQDALSTLTRGTGTCSGYSALTVALMRAAGIPAEWHAGSVVDGSFKVTRSDGSWTSFSWPNGAHAWVAVLYPNTGWVFCEPQQDINTLSIQHYLDEAPIRTSSGSVVYEAGVSPSGPSYAYSVSGVASYATPDGAWVALLAATPTHTAAVHPTSVTGHVDLWPADATWFPATSARMRAWVSGTRGLVWCRIALDGKTVAQGPPFAVLGQRTLSLAGLSDGMHTIALTAEDAAGRTFTTTREVGIGTATSMSVSAPSGPVAYGSTVTVRGKLTVAGTGELVPASTSVYLYRSSDGGVTWTRGPQATYETATGTYRATASLAGNTRFQLRFGGSGKYLRTSSPRALVYAKASLTTPSAPTSVARSTTFTSAGLLKPRHRAGTYAVKLRAYRFESGTWVLRKTVSARVSDATGGSRYAASVRLGYAGRWRVRATHEDNGHAWTGSSYRYLTAK